MGCLEGCGCLVVVIGGIAYIVSQLWDEIRFLFSKI